MGTIRNSYHTDVKLAVQVGILPEEFLKLIPKSTRHRFMHTDYSRVFGMEFSDQLHDTAHLIRQFAKDQQAIKVYRAYAQVRLVLINLFVNIPRKLTRECKRRIIYAVDRFRDIIGFLKVLKLLYISKHTYHTWKKELNFSCEDSLLHRCFRTHPQQLTTVEIEKMKELYLSEQYRGWPIYSIALHALITGELTVHVSSWYKYIHLMKLEGFRKKKQYEKNRPGIRAERLHQYWHADVTQMRTLDNIKVYIYIVMDNFSRYILSIIYPPCGPPSC